MRGRVETGPPEQLHGWVAPGFEPVQQAFADNFAQRGELGAACAVYRHGQPVVDLWGGLRDREQPWRQDTLVLVFSVTKGMTATALAVARTRGLLDYDTPVAAYWPEFAEAGKETITVRQVLAHQAGLATSTTASSWSTWPIRTTSPRSSPASGPSGRPAPARATTTSPPGGSPPS
jgi:CubicO group peptidase (beta-lactamase class C family)